MKQPSSLSTEEVVEERIRVLCLLYEKEDPELRKYFEELNAKMNELCPRVTPNMVEALERTNKLLEETKQCLSRKRKILQNKP